MAVETAVAKHFIVQLDPTGMNQGLTPAMNVTPLVDEGVDPSNVTQTLFVVTLIRTACAVSWPAWFVDPDGGENVHVTLLLQDAWA